MKKSHFFNAKPYEGRAYSKPSMTEPGQGVDVETVVRKHAKGIPVITDSRQQWADVEEAVPRLKDLTDIDEQKQFVDRVMKKIRNVRKLLEEEQKIEQSEPEGVQMRNVEPAQDETEEE